MIDSHAHYDDRRFDKDRDALLSSLPGNGIEYVINSGADMRSSRESIALAHKYDFLFAAVGVHPHSAKGMKDSDFDVLKSYAKMDKVVAIGEIGLDFHYDYSPRDIQRVRFSEQLALAIEVGLPVVIHSREAAEETFEMIRLSGVNTGVVHCYSGSSEMALEYLKLGFYIGVGGVATYKNARKLVETIELVPIERILLETDCPYLAPEPHRSKRNSSLYLPYVAEKIAAIKNIPLSDVERITKLNTLKVFPKMR